MKPDEFGAILNLMVKDFHNSKIPVHWKAEQFSLFDNDCGHPQTDLDLMFFWKVYDQWRLAAGRSWRVFFTLAKEVGGGVGLVQTLAQVINFCDPRHLKQAFDERILKASLPEVHKALRHVGGGWEVMRYSILAAQRLVEAFHPGPNQSFIQLWIARNLNLENPKAMSDLPDLLNSRISVHLSDVFEKLEQVNKLLKKLSGGKPDPSGLPGVNQEMIRYFFRDWIDISWSQYMFKWDEHNSRFWKALFAKLRIGPYGAVGRNCVLKNILATLGDDAIDTGAIAKLNTYIYRLFSRVGSEGKPENPDSYITSLIHRVGNGG